MRMPTWQLIPAALALVPAGDPRLEPRATYAANPQPTEEGFRVFPTDFNRIGVCDIRGNIDRRNVDPAAQDGLLWVGVGDVLDVSLNAPTTLIGKSGTCDICYSIREEHSKNCKKHIVHHPRTRNFKFESRLSVGHEVKIEVRLVSLNKSHAPIVRSLTPVKTERIIVEFGSSLHVKIHVSPEQAIFSPRDTLTPREIREHLQQHVDQLRSTPNVEISDFPYKNIQVVPGNLKDLKVNIAATRQTH
jgi:hypothetical protein